MDVWSLNFPVYPTKEEHAGPPVDLIISKSRLARTLFFQNVLRHAQSLELSSLSLSLCKEVERTTRPTRGGTLTTATRLGLATV